MSFKIENLPLLLNQRRLWIMHQKDKVNPGYNIPLTYHFKGEISREILYSSLEILFSRHHTLFSVFKQRNNMPCIDIETREIELLYIDFSSEPVDKRKESILKYVETDTQKSFNIETGPLYRLFLLKEDDLSHYFHLTVHHLIFDGWSRKIFVDELSVIYNTISKGESFISDSLDYHSYDHAKRESEETDIDKKNIDFWKENLKGCPAELKFPFDYIRKDHPTGLGRREGFYVSKENTQKIREICARENATVFNAVVSFIGLLLQKYTGETDVCIGIPVSSRHGKPELANTLGMFVNTSVVRLKLDGQRRINEHISYTRGVVREAIAHSSVPFDRIVEAVKPERIPGINPFFQVSCSWLNGFNIPIAFDKAIGERIYLENCVSHFDLSFYMWEDGDVIRGEIEYSADILKPETVVRVKNSFLTLINTLVNNNELPLASVSIASEKEVKMIESINNTKTDYPKEKTIIELFEDQVRMFPEKDAVVFNGDKLSYSVLNAQANKLARTLRKAGVKSDTPVGIYVEKSVEMVVGLLAILKAGGAYLPIDPDYPLSRVEFIVKESETSIILTQTKFMEIQLEGVTFIDLNSSSSYSSDPDNLSLVNCSSDLAYYMYTSGTTGVPKGSMIPHYSVVRLVRDINYMELTSEDRLLYTSAIVFDVTTFEIWGPLLNGMTLFVADKETILDVVALGETLFKNDITILHLTSALFTQLSEQRTDVFSRLKYLLVGGDVLSPHHINKVRSDNPDLKVINCYGPSENTTYSTTFLIDKTYNSNIPIGKPVSNSTVYIFDKEMNYQPVGVMGEIYVGGDGLSRGYMNRDDLNATKFVKHPLTGERLYKSGDFGKWLPDGNIEFHGRMDNQIKIRGFRVELEEIESVISEIDGVVENVVLPFKINEGDYRLISFINIHSTFVSSAEDVVGLLREKLPSYMIPSGFKFLSEFPKTINGKVDKKTLMLTDLSELESENTAEVGFMTDTERVIDGIWREALMHNGILRKDNFFDIGGTSLLAISVFSKLMSHFNLEMPLRVFFDSPRICDLAKAIEMETMKSLKTEVTTQTNKENSNIISGEL